MQYNRLVVSVLVLILTVNGRTALFCPTVPLHHLLVNAVGNDSLVSVQQHCFTIGHCHLTIITRHDHHLINLKRNDIEPLIFSSAYQLLIESNQKPHSLRFSSIINDQIINSTDLSTESCSKHKILQKRTLLAERPISRSASSTIITFNSSSFIDYHHDGTLDYPLRLSLRFRTLGRISNGVLLSLTHRTSSSLIIPYIIIEHSNGKVEITILQLDERKVLATVTTIQAGKNINNDHWHWLQFEIDDNGIFTLIVDDDSRTSQIPSYVVTDWHINALLVGDTRRLSSDIFQPFVGYMSDLVFNDEHLFARFATGKEQPINSSFQYTSQDLLIGYRITFFNLVTIDTATSYIAFSERESQNKNHGKLDIYFLFRSHVPDGIILYRYAQGLNEYFAIGLRAGVLAVFIDFGFGKRQIVSDESTKLADGKWHEVRVTRLGTDKVELIVDNRVNRSTLSTNGIRNAVSLQPVLYIGGIPNSNSINLTGSGLNAQGFQGCLASFIVDGRILDYQRALVLNGQVKMNVCSDSSNLLTTNGSDLNKLCYDFTCIHSGVCSTNGDNAPKCDCLETGYTGDRCDKLSRGFYFGKRHSIGQIEYTLPQARQTEYDVLVFGIQTLSTTAQVLRIESDVKFYSLEYEIVRGRSYIKLHLGEKQPDVYSAVAHITDGMYHVIKIIRRLAMIEFYVDGIRMKLEGGNKASRQTEQRAFLAQRRLRIGSFKNISQWNGILAGLSLNRQSIFDSLSKTLVRSGDVEDVEPNDQTGLFNLIESLHIATAIISSTSTSISTTNDSTTSTWTRASVTQTSDAHEMDPMDQQEDDEDDVAARTAQIAPRSTKVSRISFERFYNHLKHIGLRSLIISAAVLICLLLLLLLIIVRLHRKNRKSAKNLPYPYNHPNGKAYSQIKRHSVAPPDGQQSKKRVPKLLRYLHSNRSKPSPSSFRFTSNGSLSRLSSGDSYHLIASIQENHRDQKRLSNKSSNCVLNDHCYIHSTFSQPAPSPPSIYHQVNRLMLSGSEPPLPFSHQASCHPPIPTTATLRSLKKDIDNSSAQTYSAVYSCDLAANLDLDHDGLSPPRSNSARRTISTHNPTTNPLIYLFMKNLVDCYAVQVHPQQQQQQTILLASADDNKIQLSHARSGHFHSQLPVTSVGACHQILYSYQDRYLIGLFYEVTSNVNPYAVKIWSTEDYSIRANVHPIKCSIAIPSRQSSVLFMAGKQKYGRGISLGLLDLDSCSLARELKSDPDTSIGDEIKRIILTKNESYALVACTEHASTCTCFVVFKLELPSGPTDELDSAAIGSMSNCTMILTRFDCEAKFTFSMVDSNNNGDQYMLTILRANQMIIWQLSDGEIVLNYDFNFLNEHENSSEQHVVDCQMDDNRLMVLARSGTIHIWDVTAPVGEFSYITMIRDPLIHSINWLDHGHFVSIDHDGQRLRLWNLDRKEPIHESLSLSSGIQSIHVYPLGQPTTTTHGKEYLIIGLSMNERSLVMFECNPLRDEQVDSSTSPMIIC